jgi:hypothetical protein
MGERRFEELREALLQAGVADQNVRRAVSEIESHFRQLVDEEVRRGAAPRDAGIEAHRLLGTNQVLIQRYAARPELLVWSRRWPGIWFTILPVITYLAVSAATLIGVLAVSHQMTTYLHKIHLAPEVTHRIDLAARIVFLWLFPLFVAGAFAVLAYRRRVALRWPLIGIASISALAALINVGVTFTGGPTPGEIGAGIGLSLKSLPSQVTRAAILASIALVPLWLALRRAQRECEEN